jgi:hypothetical protein
MNIITQKEKVKLTFESFKPHKVYQSLFDGNFYTLAKISYNGHCCYDCLLNLNTMRGTRMCNLTAKTGEFIEVDYTFKIDTKD